MRTNIDHYEYDVLNDAQSILIEIGMPKPLRNPRCVMALAAYAGMADTTRWRNASEEYRSTHDVICFINANFPNKAGLDGSGYSENSRETFRKSTIKPWITAGIMEQKPGLAPNDKDNSYRLTAVFTALIRNFGSTRWREELQHFKETHESYQDLLRQTRNIERGYPVNYNGLEFRLGRSKHNQLQIAVLNEFVSRFAPGANLLYIGDTSDRSVVRKDEELTMLGINVLSVSTRLPDIILYDESKDRVLFIEAYSSTGEFTMDRVLEMRSYCHCPEERELAFITAFETTKKMLSVFSKISWDTDIWVAEDPTHITHKNGDRFMGRKDGDWWDQS